MGESDMAEIASVFRLLLSSSRPSKITKGRNAGTLSKARYRTDEAALGESKSRVGDLLRRFPVYPELDLEFLQRSFA